MVEGDRDRRCRLYFPEEQAEVGEEEEDKDLRRMLQVQVELEEDKCHCHLCGMGIIIMLVDKVCRLYSVEVNNNNLHKHLHNPPHNQYRYPWLYRH